MSYQKNQIILELKQELETQKKKLKTAKTIGDRVDAQNQIGWINRMQKKYGF